MVLAPLVSARRQGRTPSISISSEKLRNVLISTISPRTGVDTQTQDVPRLARRSEPGQSRLWRQRLTASASCGTSSRRVTQTSS